MAELTREQLLERKTLLERKVELESQLSTSEESQPEQQSGTPEPIVPPKLDLGIDQGKFEDIGQKIKTFTGRAIKDPLGAAGVITRAGADIAQGKLFDEDPLALAGSEFALGAADTATFGIGRELVEKGLDTIGLKPIETKNKAVNQAGKIAGLLVPAKIAISIANRIPGLAGRGIAKGIVKGSVEAGAIGFTEAPEDFLDIKQRLLQAGLSAPFGAVGVPLAKGVQNLTRVGFKAAKFAGKVRQSLFGAKRKIGDAFATQLDDLIKSNPNTVTNLEDSIKGLKESMKTNSKIASDIRLGAKRAGFDEKGTSLLERLVESPESARELTLQQSRDIIKQIRSVPSIKTNLNKGKFGAFSETDIDLIDFTDEVRKNQLGSFPELEGVNKTYSESLRRYDLIKGKFKEGKLLENIKNNFGDAEIRGIVKKLLPSKTIQEMGGFRSATNFLKGAGWISAIGLGGVISGLVFSKVTGNLR